MLLQSVLVELAIFTSLHVLISFENNLQSLATVIRWPLNKPCFLLKENSNGCEPSKEPILGCGMSPQK